MDKEFELKSFLNTYGFGDCAILATALSKKYNLDVGVIFEKGCPQLLLHAFALKDGLAVDAHGFNSIEHVMEIYKQHTYEPNTNIYYEVIPSNKAEDFLFFQHGGFDEKEVEEALNEFENIKSTTQHYKNLNFDLNKILLFHGTTDHIEKFTPQKSNNENGQDPNSTLGIHFTESPYSASEYAETKETISKVKGEPQEGIIYVVEYSYKKFDIISSPEDFYGTEEENTNNHEHFKNLRKIYLEQGIDLIHFEGGEEPISTCLNHENIKIIDRLTKKEAKILEETFEKQNIQYDDFEKRKNIIKKIKSINYEIINLDEEKNDILNSLIKKQYYQEAEELAKKESLGLTPDKELKYVVCDKNNNVIGASWTSFDTNTKEYSFDIVVNRDFQSLNIGSMILDEVINIPKKYIDYDPFSKHNITVTSERMKTMLENRNFDVKQEYFNNWIMEKKENRKLKLKP